jgi:hypothetical protein
MIAVLGLAVVAIGGVSVFYWKHEPVVPRVSRPVAQVEDAPPPADAPPTNPVDRDGRFIYLLRAQGLQVSGPREVTISEGSRVCRRFQRGESKQQIVQEILEGSPGMSADTATTFTDTAIDVYCPQG